MRLRVYPLAVALTREKGATEFLGAGPLDRVKMSES